MKKVYSLLLIVMIGVMISCSDESNSSEYTCGTKVVSGVTRTLYTGPQGGCYYYNSNNNKTYVDRSDCSC